MLVTEQRVGLGGVVRYGHQRRGDGHVALHVRGFVGDFIIVDPVFYRENEVLRIQLLLGLMAQVLAGQQGLPKGNDGCEAENKAGGKDFFHESVFVLVNKCGLQGRTKKHFPFRKLRFCNPPFHNPNKETVPFGGAAGVYEERVIASSSQLPFRSWQPAEATFTKFLKV